MNCLPLALPLALPSLVRLLVLIYCCCCCTPSCICSKLLLQQFRFNNLPSLLSESWVMVRRSAGFHWKQTLM